MKIARIVGGERLSGSVEVGGSKNACLPVLAASLLTEDECVIHNIPRLSDIATMLEIFSSMGVVCSSVGEHSLRISARKVTSEAPTFLVRKMRASVCLMGALICRAGRAAINVPGGCLIGARPIDLHIKGFKALGCRITENGDLFAVDGSDLRGTEICLSGERGSTMTGTINVMMAALRAKGETTISCAAKEPEVVDFCRCLVAMGAKIDGIGTSILKIFGGIQLHGCEHTVIGDRIEAGTFICAGLMTDGDVKISGLGKGFLSAFLSKLREIGAKVSQDARGIIHVKPSGQLAGTEVETGPHPGFPTDLQAQFCALLTQSKVESSITEKIYPDRFSYVQELKRAGADISVSGPRAHIGGNSKLKGAHVVASDLRASAALYLAGLCAKGNTFVHDVYHLDRGYENFEGKLCSLGAKIERFE
ncbi:MAG: UDP-N-acetylglucosamine 1-carboxyvinyltransferase [Puniceicoccales bacterium]|jgi:UDP-N-acetylglucosamine 1-carboxyvinyltransferase|nr:UDP-N-acetylglucosamine 1-carboxyvinyltransferase [Puniceicoccales bacterium]